MLKERLPVPLHWGCPACGYCMKCSRRRVEVQLPALRGPEEISGRAAHGWGWGVVLNPKYSRRRASRN